MNRERGEEMQKWSARIGKSGGTDRVHVSSGLVGGGIVGPTWDTWSHLSSGFDRNIYIRTKQSGLHIFRN